MFPSRYKDSPDGSWKTGNVCLWGSETLEEDSPDNGTSLEASSPLTVVLLPLLVKGSPPASAQDRQYEQKMGFRELQQQKSIKLGLLVVVGTSAKAAVPPPFVLKGSQLSCDETGGMILR